MWMRAIGLGVLVCAACACPSKQADATATTAAAGSGAIVATPGSAAGATCESVRGKIDAMYREEAQRKEPKRVDDAVADNTAMVMSDCAKDPAKVAPCVAAVTTVADLEKTCLAPLDPEGTEGNALGGRR